MVDKAKKCRQLRNWQAFLTQYGKLFAILNQISSILIRHNEATGEFATTPGRVIVDGATYSRDPNTGAIITTPGVATLVVTGNI